DGDNHMKKLITLAILASCSTASLAQGNVTIYGLIDTSIRYTSSEQAHGGHKLEMNDGMITGSRLGIRATEDLGNSLKAIAVLESGFAPDTGASQQGGRLFGRQSYIGLEGEFGKVLLGRPYTVAYDMSCGFVAFEGAINAIMAYPDLSSAVLR